MSFFGNLLGYSSTTRTPAPSTAVSAGGGDTRWLQQRLASGNRYADQPCQFRTATSGFVKEANGTWSYRTDLASNRGPCVGVRAEEQISNSRPATAAATSAAASERVGLGDIPKWVWFLGGVIILMYLSSRQPAAAAQAVMPSVGYIDEDYGDIEDYPLSNGGSVNLMSSSRRTGSPPQTKTAAEPKKRQVRWKD